MSDSDETLPPDSRNNSPDLFDDEGSRRRNKVTTTSKQTTMKKRRSQVHEMSDSDSDDSQKQRKHSINHTSSTTTSKGNDKITQAAEGNDTISKPVDAKPEQSDKHKARKKFIKDFLDMAFSDSDEDIDSKPDVKSNDMNTGSHKRESKSNNSYGNSSNLSMTDKPYKQDYSKRYTETKHGPSTNGAGKLETDIKREKYETGERMRKETPHGNFKHKEATNHIEKGAATKESPSSSLKRKHSRSPVLFNETKDHKKKEAASIEANCNNSALKRKHSKYPTPNELRKSVTEILKDSDEDAGKPMCKYGSECYRKNPSHLKEFSHPGKKRKSSLTSTAIESPPPPKKVKTSMEIPSSSMKTSVETSSSSRKTSVEMPSTSRQSLKDRHEQPTISKPVDKRDNKTSRPRSPPNTPRSISEKYRQAQPYSFFLTKVSGIEDKYNSSFAMDMKDILSPEMGNLTESCQFNFMFDIPWIIKQYPPVFRTKPLLIVHGEQGPSKAKLQGDAMMYTHIRFCQAKLEIMYGTHHTKMMLLLYDKGMRVVIHTSNLIPTDWHQKTQGIWISPLFPKLPSPSKEKGDSLTFFKKDLINYITAYKAYQLKQWIEHIEQHDMSSARAVIVGSVPGRHQGDSEKFKWGHLKLRKILKQHGPDPSTVKSWPVIGQFSSIGSMGPNKENWVCGEFLESMASAKSSGLHSNVRLQLIFPSKDNVRLCLEGFPAGGSIPYSVKTAKKQTYLHDFFHVWMSEGRGRSGAMPHIKSYVRPKQDGTVAAWFIVTSANLSKAAWGALEKKGAQLMIRSYEIGVLFLPKFFDSGEVFETTSDINAARSSQKFILPYDLPVQKYEKKDRPWMWDIPYMDLPDTNGNVWCPFSK